MRLAHRPTRSGLVVPYISMTTADGTAHLGQTRGKAVGECIVQCRCQICGRPLDRSRPLLFLVTQQNIDEGFTSEPALHPECAAYSIKACPMISGRMPTYAKHQADLTGLPCDEPGCRCAGIVSDVPGRAGQPAPDWYRAWYRDYGIGVADKTRGLTVGNITGAVLLGEPVKIRPLAPVDGTG
jgi:hypothetical protein